jgi:hypothetical protein
MKGSSKWARKKIIEEASGGLGPLHRAGFYLTKRKD